MKEIRNIETHDGTNFLKLRHQNNDDLGEVEIPDQAKNEQNKTFDKRKGSQTNSDNKAGLESHNY